MILFSLALTLIAVGIYGILAKKNLLKIFFSLTFMEFGIVLLFMLAGFRHELITGDTDMNPLSESMVQALVIVGIVFTVIAAALIVRLKEKYGTFDVTLIRKLNG
jgi:multicomponent Na+:H+ antiporter subunit C